jgi:hypothetical protein
MQKIPQSPITYKRIAYHAALGGVCGQAMRDAQGRVWFVSDDDEVRQLSDADIPALQLNGRVDLAADQRREDLVAGKAPRICTTRGQEVQ